MVSDRVVLSIAGIISLTMLETCALLKNIDGAMFGAVIAAIAGIAGYSLKDVIERVKK